MDRHARRKLLADIRELAQGDEGLRGHLRLARWTAVMPLDDRAAYLRNLEELLEDAGDGAYKIARASDALSEEFGPQLRLDSPDGRERELGVALAKAGSDLGIAEGKVNRALDGVADAINALADHHGIRMASSRAARDEPLAMSRETFFRLTGLDADDWGIAERGADVYVWPGGTARTTLPGGRDVTLSGPGYVSPTTLKAVARAYDQATRRGLYAGYARAPGRIAQTRTRWPSWPTSWPTSPRGSPSCSGGWRGPRGRPRTPRTTPGRWRGTASGRTPTRRPSRACGRGPSPRHGRRTPWRVRRRPCPTGRPASPPT